MRLTAITVEAAGKRSRVDRARHPLDFGLAPNEIRLCSTGLNNPALTPRVPPLAQEL